MELAACDHRDGVAVATIENKLSCLSSMTMTGALRQAAFKPKLRSLSSSSSHGSHSGAALTHTHMFVCVCITCVPLQYLCAENFKHRGHKSTWMPTLRIYTTCSFTSPPNGPFTATLIHVSLHSLFLCIVLCQHMEIYFPGVSYDAACQHPSISHLTNFDSALKQRSHLSHYTGMLQISVIRRSLFPFMFILSCSHLQMYHRSLFPPPVSPSSLTNSRMMSSRRIL